MAIYCDIQDRSTYVLLLSSIVLFRISSNNHIKIDVWNLPTLCVNEWNSFSFIVAQFLFLCISHI